MNIFFDMDGVLAIYDPKDYSGKYPKWDQLGAHYFLDRKPDKRALKMLKLLDKYAPVKFLSCEPLLSDLGELELYGIDWVIVGGESGNQARPMKKEWVLNIKRQCEEQGVPFFFKQWGTWGEDGVMRNKKANGCLLDGKVCQEWPKVLRQTFQERSKR